MRAPGGVGRRWAPVLAVLAVLQCFTLLLLGLGQSAHAGDRPRGCGQPLPVAGSAGFANAQAARRTNVNTYGAAAIVEQATASQAYSGDLASRFRSGEGHFRLTFNDTFGAARLLTLCDDRDPGDQQTVMGVDDRDRWLKKDRLYEQPLDLYATNVYVSGGAQAIGGFYSASVTQSVLGYRGAMVAGQVINLYPAFFAPAVGNWQRGDGVASYAVDWVAGGYLDLGAVAARVGTAGANGLFVTVDERAIGLFGTLSRGVGEAQADPLAYLRAGLQGFSLRRFGAPRLSEAIGQSSLFFRDMPVGVDPSGDAELSRLRTLHLDQRAIAQQVEAALSYRVGQQSGLYDVHLGWHTPGFYGERSDLKGSVEAEDEGFGIRVGMIDVAPRYSLGVQGGRYFSARAQLRGEAITGMILFNDPEQLALFPFATNALSLRLVVDLAAGG